MVLRQPLDEEVESAARRRGTDAGAPQGPAPDQLAEADPANDLLVWSAVDQARGSPGAVEPADGGLAGEQGVELLLADVVVPHVAGAHGQG
jgi:hypothetical protein